MTRSRFLPALMIIFLLLSFGSVQAGQLDIGDKAPNFKATTTDGKTITLSDVKGTKAAVICFTCNNCPVARAYEDRFVEFSKKYAARGVKFIAVNVNTGETLEKMKKRSENKKFTFPYAYDASGKSAEAYGARVTPHLFILDSDGVVAYIGAFDDNMNPQKVKKHYAADAIDALLKSEKPAPAKTRPVGCTIKH